MFISEQQYKYGTVKYSYQEIEDRLNAICNIDKENSWVHPDLTTKPVSNVAKRIRGIKFPFNWLANRFYIFRAVTSPLNWLIKRVYKWNGIEIEKSKLFLEEIKKCARTNFHSRIALLANDAISKFNLQFPKHQLTQDIQIPLLDTKDQEYNLKLFQSDLSSNAKYKGANRL